MRDSWRLNTGRPFDDGRDAEAALIHRSLKPAQPAGRRWIKTGQTPIVTREPHKGVFVDLQFAKAGAQRADAAVHGDQFTIMLLRLGAELGERLFVGIIGYPRIVWGAVPDDREERFLRRNLDLDELQRLVDDDFRGVAAVLLNFTLTTHDRVAIEKIRHRQPFIETKSTRVMGVLLEDRGAGASQSVQVPFAKMRGGVTGVFHRLAKRLLLLPQCVAMVEHAGAVVGAPG